MGFWHRLLDTAKDAFAQPSQADDVVYPAGSATWSGRDLQCFHATLAPYEAAVADGLGTILPLKLYARLPVSQREETMGRVSALVAAVLGFAPPAPVVVDQTNRQASWYAQGLIVLNHRTLVDPREALHTALHESFHCFQKKSIDRWRRGELPAADPLLPIVPVWAYNFAHYITPTPKRRALYLRQPLEYHAERFARRVLAQIDWIEPAAPPPIARQGGGDDLYDMMYD